MIADTPGHIQYTRNMVTGASTADVAVILIDARKGVVEQTRRHAYIASLVGVRHLVACVNKMDLVGFDEAAFDAVIIDSPPFLSLSDAAILAGAVGQVLVVISRGQSRRDDVSRMFNELGRIEANVVGVVVNRGPNESTYSSYYRPPRLRAVGEENDGFDDDIRANVRGTS